MKGNETACRDVAGCAEKKRERESERQTCRDRVREWESGRVRECVRVIDRVEEGRHLEVEGWPTA